MPTFLETEQPVVPRGPMGGRMDITDPNFIPDPTHPDLPAENIFNRRTFMKGLALVAGAKLAVDATACGPVNVLPPPRGDGGIAKTQQPDYPQFESLSSDLSLLPEAPRGIEDVLDSFSINPEFIAATQEQQLNDGTIVRVFEIAGRIPVASQDKVIGMPTPGLLKLVQFGNRVHLVDPRSGFQELFDSEITATENGITIVAANTPFARAAIGGPNNSELQGISVDSVMLTDPGDLAKTMAIFQQYAITGDAKQAYVAWLSGVSVQFTPDPTVLSSLLAGQVSEKATGGYLLRVPNSETSVENVLKGAFPLVSDPEKVVSLTDAKGDTYQTTALFTTVATIGAKPGMLKLALFSETKPNATEAVGLVPKISKDGASIVWSEPGGGADLIVTDKDGTAWWAVTGVAEDGTLTLDELPSDGFVVPKLEAQPASSNTETVAKVTEITEADLDVETKEALDATLKGLHDKYVVEQYLRDEQGRLILWLKDTTFNQKLSATLLVVPGKGSILWATSNSYPKFLEKNGYVNSDAAIVHFLDGNNAEKDTKGVLEYFYAIYKAKQANKVFEDSDSFNQFVADSIAKSSASPTNNASIHLALVTYISDDNSVIPFGMNNITSNGHWKSNAYDVSEFDQEGKHHVVIPNVESLYMDIKADDQPLWGPRLDKLKEVAPDDSPIKNFPQPEEALTTLTSYQVGFWFRSLKMWSAGYEASATPTIPDPWNLTLFLANPYFNTLADYIGYPRNGTSELAKIFDPKDVVQYYDYLAGKSTVFPDKILSQMMQFNKDFVNNGPLQTELIPFTK